MKMIFSKKIQLDSIGDLSTYKKSAVGVHLFENGTDLKIVLIQRPPYDGPHGGQMALPGGKAEPTDVSLEHTARRESFEEVGIPIESGVLLGKLTDITIPVSKYIMTPFVFFHSEMCEMIKEPREVDEIVWVSLEELSKAEVKLKDIHLNSNLVRKNAPHFELQNKVVWGATSMVLAEFRELI